MNFRTYTPSALSPQQRHHYLLGSVNPRPICFASTLNAHGIANLAPYSFFNIFSSTPPVFILSANTTRDGMEKHTLQNVRNSGELVINLVNYPMARQMAICGIEYNEETDEFEKSGFTPLPSQLIKPFRVKESPVQFECKVLEIKSLGDHPGAANLIIAEALLMHFHEDIFSPDDTIDPQKIDMIGRLGNFNYCRAQYPSVFAIKQPQTKMAIGFDKLPAHLQNSTILTGFDLGMMAGALHLPSAEDTTQFAQKKEIQLLLQSDLTTIHKKIQQYLQSEEIDMAWMLALQVE